MSRCAPLVLSTVALILAGCVRRNHDPSNAMLIKAYCDTTPERARGPLPRLPAPLIVEGLGSIVGTVAQREVGNALTSSAVRLSQSRKGYRLALREHYTDSAGGFRIDSVVPGNYRLSARRLGYSQDSVEILVRSSRADSVRFELRAYRCLGY